MRVLVDTAVVMYAAGKDHPLREPCRQVLRAAVVGELDAHVSAEVAQEILHRFSHLGDTERGAAMAEAALDLLGPALPLTDAIARRTAALARAHPSATARDLVHVATCIDAGITHLVSPDRDFDAFGDIERIDPAAVPPPFG